MRVAVILLMGSLVASAYWDDETNTLGCERVSMVNAKGTEQTYARLVPGMPTEFSILTRAAVRWNFSADAAGKVRVYRTLGRSDSAIGVLTIAPGKSSLRLFCEPDKYRIVTTVPLRGKLYVFRNLPLNELVPVGGGYPVVLQSKDNSTTPYYYMSMDTSVVMRVAGPGVAYMYVRGFVALSGGPNRLEVKIYRGDAAVADKLIESVPSADVAFEKPMIGYVPAKATLIKLTVPKGVQNYKITVPNSRALVRLYVKKETVKRATHSKTPVLGRAKPRTTSVRLASSPSPAAAATGSPTPEPAEGAAVQGLELGARTGIYLNNNVFTYGDDKLDGYPPTPQYAYRYPNVRQLHDWYYPLGVRLRYSLNSMQIRAAVNGELYTSNTRLNAANYLFALGWNGPASIEAAYSFRPDNPIRDTYAGDSTNASYYTMLTYAYHRADMSMSMRNRWRPRMTFSYAMYDYCNPFDYLNAVLFEAKIAMGRDRVFGHINDKMAGFNLSVAVGNVMAVQPSSLDRSNTYFSVTARGDIDIRSWTLGVMGDIRPRYYTTESDSDDNRGRRDLEYGFTPMVQYQFRTLTATLHLVDVACRNVTAADPGDETSKSYVSLGTGFRLSYSFRPLSLIGGTRS